MKQMNSVRWWFRVATSWWPGFWLLFATTAPAQGLRSLAGHVPPVVAHLQPLEVLPGTNHLRLVISLPWRNQTELDGLLGGLTDPGSTNYHQWLTPEQFTQKFGPTEADYQKVAEFARANGLAVKALASNRMLLDVDAPVATIEKAFHLTLRRYAHPSEARNFYAPDTEPTVAADVPILHIRGLDNYTLPHRLGGPLSPVPLTTNHLAAFYTGSAPGGYFMGKDFRAAYVPGVTNTGAGQSVAIIDVGGPYYPNDIYLYETNAGLSTNIMVTNVLLSGWTGIPNGTSEDDGEEALDIDMAMSMAPGATILVYEGDGADIFNKIASDDIAKQMTLSYGFGIDAGIIQSFQQFLAQGQAMSQASGDGDSDLNGGTGLTGNPYATIVGGTTLTTSRVGGPWSSETAWNWGNNGGSGGGISGYGIPNWQQGINMTANLGSTTFRNYPDVAMPADGVFLISQDGNSVGWVGGTSCASPLWAGFMALVNQRAASLGKPAIGFANPPIYAIGRGPYSTYATCFHDITTGNNFDSQNPNRFPACAGYDLCTGWGTPTGINTLAALAGSGTNNFTFAVSPDELSLVRGGTAVAELTMTRLNGATAAATFSLTGVPAGVTAVLSPATTTSTAQLTLTSTSAAVVGTNLITLTGTGGGLTHSETLTVAITAPVPGAVAVSLSPFYNRPGIWTDKRTFNGGLDGGGYAYSASLLGTAPTWNGIVFKLGPANANDAVSCAGQTIALPAGNFNTIQVLGTAVDGSQVNQPFTVTYADNSTATITQSLSDWANPQGYSGESQVVGMAYRNNGGGAPDLSTPVTLYGYTLTLNQTNRAVSLKLPVNASVEVLAVVLANDPVSAPLGAYYNRAGLYTDGTTFTNPATGGLDGGGSAYSATLLTGAQTWAGTPFNFGPANATNVISAARQVIALPPGHYVALRMLATGVQGGQVSEPFTVRYTDGTASNLVQSLSDWYSPANYSGEAQAVVMGHRNVSDGTADNRTFYLYGYSFILNSSKVIQSLQLPNDANVVVLAVSLVPDWPPTFNANPFIEPGIIAGQTYAANLATNASDLNAGSLTFAKFSGPAWLSLSPAGALGGEPLSANAGLNAFGVSVTDAGGFSNTATLNILVSAAPPIVAGLYGTVTNLWLGWSGGIAPYQPQMSTNPAMGGWLNAGGPISSNVYFLQPSNPAAFYRIMGQ
jgi:hypothetical protein